MQPTGKLEEVKQNRATLIEDIETFFEADHFLREPKLLQMIDECVPYEAIMRYLWVTHEDEPDRGVEMVEDEGQDFENLDSNEITYHLELAIEISRHPDDAPQPGDDVFQWMQREFNSMLDLEDPTPEQLDVWQDLKDEIEELDDARHEPTDAFLAREWGFHIGRSMVIYWSPVAPHIATHPRDKKSEKWADEVLEAMEKLGGLQLGMASFILTSSDPNGVYYHVRKAYPEAVPFGTENGRAPSDQDISYKTPEGDYFIN